MNRDLSRGYCGIGIFHGKASVNIGTLWRSAAILDADFIFTIGRRYKDQPSDTGKSWRSIPLWTFPTIDDLILPRGAQLIGVELDDKATPLRNFYHPAQAVYLLGAEDHGLSAEAIVRCHRLISLPGDYSMNVAVAGSIVLYERYVQLHKVKIAS
jgi:tRNA G18 (ribose-2'-O)-methylase SpoU